MVSVTTSCTQPAKPMPPEVVGVQADLVRMVKQQAALVEHLSQSIAACQMLADELNGLLDKHEANDPMAVVQTLEVLVARRAAVLAAQRRPH